MDIVRRFEPQTTNEAAFPATVPLILQRVYRARGIHGSAELDYGLQHLLPVNTLRDIEPATERLLAAHSLQERVLIVGDFDADGATSCAVGVRGLTALGFNNVDFLVPNRFEYGYGLTPEIVAVAAEMKPDLIVTVDNGIVAHAGVEHANSLGIDVIVTDHHLPADTLPPAIAIVNPNQVACEFASKSIAGVGVMFYVLLALRAALDELGWFAEKGITKPNLAEFLDLVALGTVADVVSLDYNNRILVEQGLRRIRAGRACAGILALLESAGRDPARLTSTDLGFILGPRLNAAGRMEDMAIGIRCLLSDEPALASELAGDLEALNKNRRSVESGMQREAEQMLDDVFAQRDSDSAELPNSICLFEQSWHQGVIGILASRIKERFHRPTIAFAPADNGQLKGSARSIKGLHIRDIIAEVDSRAPDLIKQFGGHAMAAGLSLPEQNYQDFAELLEQVVCQYADEEILQQRHYSDGELDSGEFSLQVAHQLRFAGPWGQSCPEPVFDGEFFIEQQRLVGEKHLKMVVTPVNQPEQLIDAIAFNVDLQQWPDQSINTATMLYKLDVNFFRGRENVQLIVDSLQALR